MSVLVVGSVALDSVETPFGKHGDLLGGSATYFSISAGFFTDVRLVAVVGTDFPTRHVKLLRDRGIDTGGLTIEKGLTFRWKGRYEYDMNIAKTLETHLNVFQDFHPSIPNEWRATRNIFLANIDPDLQRTVLSQVSSPRLVACDSMNFWIENKRESLIRLLKKIDIFLANDGEARQLAGETNLLKAAKRILAFGPRMVIIKKGEHGSLLVSGKAFFSMPGFPLENICDPTGAGDTFAGGLMGYLSRHTGRVSEAAVRKAIVYGSVMASFNVEQFSLNGLLRLNKKLIEKRYGQFLRLVSCG